MNRKSVILTVALALFVVLFSFNVVTAQDSAETPFLGIEFEPIEGGVRVTQVLPDSPAASAGLQQDDVITAINGEPIEADYLADTIRGFEVDDQIDVSVLRDGEALDLEVMLTATPETEATVSSLPMDSYVYIQDGDQQAWQIRSLTENNPLYEAGLRAGDTITHFNGEAYDPTALGEFLADLEGDATVTVTVERDDQTLDMDVPASALEVLDRFSLGFSFSDDAGALIPFNEFFDFQPFGFFGNEDGLFNRLQEMLERYSGPEGFWSKLLGRDPTV